MDPASGAVSLHAPPFTPQDWILRRELGKAPDTIEGVMLAELYMAEALGIVGKPLFRVHTAGSVGG